MSVNDIIKGAVAVQKSINGIITAFEDAPSSINQLPCFVTYPSEGDLAWPRPIMHRIIYHTLSMDLYIQKGGDIQAADRILKPYIDIVVDAFDQNIQLGGAVFNCGVIKYHYGKLEYAGVEYLGIKFILKAEERKQVVYKA